MFFKKYKLSKWLFQLILLGLVCYFLYQQLTKIRISSFSELKIQYPAMFLLAIFLIFINWYFEFLKWGISIRLVQKDTSKNIQYKSFMAGVISGFLTPNLLGNFVGRMYYFKRVHRSSIILLSLLSNGAQFLASMLFGIFSLFLLNFPFDLDVNWIIGLKILMAFAVLVYLIYYFSFEFYYPRYFKRKKWFGIFLQRLKSLKTIRVKLLLLSLLRHVVFALQYVLVLNAFGITLKFEVFVIVWNVFFWSTLIPSLWFGKILIRESVAIWIFTLNGYEGEVVLLSSVIIWFMNQGLIALISVPYLKWKQDV
jgi:uncharacterized membrane protein YbhN (UPF0104 family)